MFLRKLLACAGLVVVGCDEGASAELAATRDAMVDARTDASLDARTPVVRADASRDADTPPDAHAADSATPASATFESAVTTLEDGAILIEKVSYLSQGLRVFGQVCRPKADGRHPVHVINHGGFSGISDWNGGECAKQAQHGWIVAESTYRGEDGSEGRVEVCLGEVDDVLRLTEIVRAQPYADPERVLMSGLSHGGCITLRALQRGAPVHLAVDIFGPTDWTTAYASWKSALAAGTTQTAAYQQLIAALEQATGGTPEQVPDAYNKRSPITFSADLERAKAPLLIVQGTADAFVPTAQACTFAAGGFDRYHVNIFGLVSPSAPTSCAGTWLVGPRPTTSWPSHRYLIVYDDVGHNLEGLASSYLIADMAAFLSARFPD